MGIFKSKSEKQLDDIINSLEMNMSNNYKDNAQDNLKDLEETLFKMKECGSIKGKVASKYDGIVSDYKDKMSGYTHKDQKPYWT